MSQFDRLTDAQLRDFLAYCGKNPEKYKHRSELLEKARKGARRLRRAIVAESVEHIAHHARGGVPRVRQEGGAMQLNAKDPSAYEGFQLKWAGASITPQVAASNPYGAAPYGAPPPAASPYGAAGASPYGLGAPAYPPAQAAASPPAPSYPAHPAYPPSQPSQPSYPAPASSAPSAPAYPGGSPSYPGAAPAYPGGANGAAYPSTNGGAAGYPHAAGHASRPSNGATANGLYPGASLGPHAGAPGHPVTPVNQHSHHHVPSPYAGVPPTASTPTHQSVGQPISSGGRKKALVIGCNYPGTRAALGGCVNDALCMEYLLKTKFGFRPEDIRVLRDDQGPNRPTRQNIVANIQWLMHGIRAGDSVFFHFSGHGSQKRDWSGDERDGMNETICPTDFQSAGQIVDDELNRLLVNPVPAGARMHAVVDACHSGTALDLPYQTKIDKYSGSTSWRKEGRPSKKGTRGGLAIQFGACKDSQTAADTAAFSSDNTSTGAATFLFIQAVEHLSVGGHHNITYAQVLADMQKQIKKLGKGKAGGSLGNVLMGGLIGGLLGDGAGAMLGAAAGGVLGGGMSKVQKPQLSASEPLDLNVPMLI